MTSEARAVQAPGAARSDVAPHHCFACGTLNTHGLGLAIHVEPRRAWANVELDRRFQGWDDIAHGGIICTILDEVMAWSLASQDDWGVTARMQVEFRKPVPISQPIRAEAWITRSRRRIFDTEGRLTDVATDMVLATATGVYLAADAARKAELRERYGIGRVGASR